jgi:hypothetical protein
MRRSDNKVHLICNIENWRSVMRKHYAKTFETARQIVIEITIIRNNNLNIFISRFVAN